MTDEKKAKLANPQLIEFKKKLEILKCKASREEHHITLNEKYFEELGLSYLLDKEPLVDKDIGKLAKTKGNSGQTVNGWCNNGYFPKAEYLLRLAKAFNVSVEWILGENDTITPELEKEYAAFKNYGISEPAYRNLVEMKERGVDMNKLMVGLNYILSFKEERIFCAEGESTECLPILERLNDFFNLYEEGLPIEFKATKIQSWIDRISKTRDNLTAEDYEKILNDSWSAISPYRLDTQNLLMLEDYLKQCKGKLVKRTLDSISEADEDRDNSIYVSNRYPHRNRSQKSALNFLNRVYNNIKEDDK